MAAIRIRGRRLVRLEEDGKETVPTTTSTPTSVIVDPLQVIQSKQQPNDDEEERSRASKPISTSICSTFISSSSTSSSVPKENSFLKGSTSLPVVSCRSRPTGPSSRSRSNSRDDEVVVLQDPSRRDSSVVWFISSDSVFPASLSLHSLPYFFFFTVLHSLLPSSEKPCETFSLVFNQFFVCVIKQIVQLSSCSLASSWNLLFSRHPNTQSNIFSVPSLEVIL